MDSKRGPKNARESNRPHLSLLSNMDSKRGPTQQGATRPCQRVANPVEKDKHSSKLIVAEPAHFSMKAKRGSTPKVVANPVKKERDSSKLIVAEPAQRGVNAGGVDAAMSDPLAVYLEKEQCSSSSECPDSSGSCLQICLCYSWRCFSSAAEGRCAGNGEVPGRSRAEIGKVGG